MSPLRGWCVYEGATCVGTRSLLGWGGVEGWGAGGVGDASDAMVQLRLHQIHSDVNQLPPGDQATQAAQWTGAPVGLGQAVVLFFSAAHDAGDGPRLPRLAVAVKHACGVS